MASLERKRGGFEEGRYAGPDSQFEKLPVSGSSASRTFCSASSGNRFVLLHMIRKTSKTVPRAEIEIAKERWEDFKDRMEARPRKRQRAAGGDAP